MENYLRRKIKFFWLVLFFICIQKNFIFSYSINKEDTIFPKSPSEIFSTIYNYCDIEESRLAVSIIQNIKNFINIKNLFLKDSVKKYKKNTCLINNKKLTEFIIFFENLERESKRPYNLYACSLCEKTFQSKYFFFLHYKFFHLKNIQKIIDINKLHSSTIKDHLFNLINKDLENIVCPSDLCLVLNCDRYKKYLKYEKNQDDKFKYKQIECNSLLENFYLKSCMRLVKDCFLSDDKTEYFEFYKNFCRRKKCNFINIDNGEKLENKGNKKNSLDLIIKKNDFEKLSSDETFLNYLKIIIFYLLSVFGLIYILSIWIVKYSS